MQQEAVQQIEQQILLPHQMKRLRQLIFQVRLAQYAPSPLRSPLVAETIGLTAAQQAKLFKTMEEQRAKTQMKKDALWKEVLATCVESLTPEQRARYHRLVGKPFEPDKT